MKGAPSVPKIFIGSSGTSKFIADSIKSQLGGFADCMVWTETFPLSKNTLESLINQFTLVDFGIFILSDDDTVFIRKQEYKITRDNVLFESGMSIGGLGRDRTFLVVPIREPGYHLATDLAGITIASYENDDLKISADHAVKGPVDKIKAAILASRWAQLDLALDARIIVDRKESVTYKLKIWVDLINKEKVPITVESIKFKLVDFFVAEGRGKEQEFIPKLFRNIEFQYKGDTLVKKIDIRKDVLTIGENSSTDCFIPVDLESGLNVLRESFGNRLCGFYDIRCIVHGKSRETFSYSLAIHSDRVLNNSESDFTVANLTGPWINTWPTGKERVHINNERLYYIDGKEDADFAIIHFSYDKKTGLVVFTKDPLKGKPRYVNKLTVVTPDLLIGEEWKDNKFLHQIRYTRVK